MICTNKCPILNLFSHNRIHCARNWHRWYEHERRTYSNMISAKFMYMEGIGVFYLSIAAHLYLVVTYGIIRTSSFIVHFGGNVGKAPYSKETIRIPFEILDTLVFLEVKRPLFYVQNKKYIPEALNDFINILLGNENLLRRLWCGFFQATDISLQ